MKRATEAGIKKALKPFYSVEEGIYVMSEGEADSASSEIMSNFSGVYCSILPTKAGTYVFSVVLLAKSKKTFFKALIR
ncbi:MAG: hypothetical protein LUG99_01660 [Lachnospiraceae bacterium]|nr:hypothetical protein [Lachnospiraceae bacterium]